MSQPAPQIAQSSEVDSRWYQAAWMTALRVLASGFAIVVGLGIVLVTLAVGDCSAFGGTCPRQGGFSDDVFRMAASGGALAVAVPSYLKRPTLRRLAVALGLGIAAGVAVGLFAVSATAG